jgi:hypothetical protein
LTFLPPKNRTIPLRVEKICFKNWEQRVSKEAEFSNSIKKCADLFRQELPKDFS